MNGGPWWTIFSTLFDLKMEVLENLHGDPIALQDQIQTMMADFKQYMDSTKYQKLIRGLEILNEKRAHSDETSCRDEDKSARAITELQKLNAPAGISTSGKKQRLLGKDVAARTGSEIGPSLVYLLAKREARLWRR